MSKRRLCNEVLTRVKSPKGCDWPTPERYEVGQVRVKHRDFNGEDVKYRITGFYVSEAGLVMANIQWLGKPRTKTVIWIGDKDSFQEKFVTES